LDPGQSFDSADDALYLIRSIDPGLQEEAMRAIVEARMDCEEYKFAAEVLQGYGARTEE